MKIRTFIASATVALQIVSASGQADMKPVNDELPNPYQPGVRNWATHPDGRAWGSTAGIDIGPKGEIWAIDRCGMNTCDGSNLPTIHQIDPATGRAVKSIGAGLFVFPHGLHVDRDGNIWVTDGQPPSGSKDRTRGHQVIKLSPDGKVLMKLGMAGMAGGGADHFSEPCDVITASNGDIFVGDGHSGQSANATASTPSRILKFSKDGKFIKEWGKWGSAPGEFKTPHALAFDSRGRLLVADRGNVRIQIFDQNGKFLEEWKQFSRVSGMYIDRDDTLYAIDSESTPTNHPGWKKGVRIGSARSGKVMYFVPGHETETPGGAAGEGIVVDAKGTIYAAENTLRGITRYVRK
jgi:sugar lactone lactonase YvrE